MKNLKVGKKLFISYVLILIVLIAGCAVSIVDLVKLGGQIETFYNGPFMVNDSAGSKILQSNARESRACMQDMLGAMAEISESSCEIRKIIKTSQAQLLRDLVARFKLKEEAASSI